MEPYRYGYGVRVLIFMVVVCSSTITPEVSRIVPLAGSPETKAFIEAIKMRSQQEQMRVAAEDPAALDDCQRRTVHYWKSLTHPLNEGCEDGKGLLVNQMSSLDSRRGKVKGMWFRLLTEGGKSGRVEMWFISCSPCEL